MANTPKEPKKVKAPEGCEIYLTGGKIYDVKSIIGEPIDETGWYLTIEDDFRQEIHTIQYGSSHLNGGDWIIVETV